MTPTIPTYPTNQFDIPLAHKIDLLYKTIYQISPKIPKKDRFGLYLKIENTCLDIFKFVISACFETKTNKLFLLRQARINIEILKRFIRMAGDLKITQRKDYLNMEIMLQEISKMTNGWIKYLN
ncbi:MAG: hypothetical protein COS76_01350 [Candidatus Portnoybacteria bacterium CG06_land_8_20_14_3_00_39_12]|uniref:bAvd-like domain-containing protein n=2 Tax=Candidatus Portnoyibacteriota TaxID=1817913 RepID=A0A2M7UIR7_9BACT|nr:MAG: hypothetical protein COS76_01350 [Candidatus Portnoybacteria bacterium CG06_land_8_20_14_3_00_39_12]PIZ71133.1 MAG: hypothetical protein COY09_01200 [Candidatus Portnoybacteria bacterium CG_4_10_14_0_2_um_filter_39_11]